MKKILILLVVALGTMFRLSADEGMWLLPYLQKLNFKEMKAKGLNLTPEQIYNSNGNSLKDAIVIFGNGCTGEIVSPDGLIFTNHHCGYGSIQALSSVENDYLEDGFWAMNRSQELPAPGLKVTFIRSIDEITNEVLEGVNANTTEAERLNIAAGNIKTIQVEYEKQNPGKTIQIKDFFGGNNYFVFVMEIYNDVRLVGTPPSSIGKFGGDTDNWMWPRHTGDFSIFRVYTAPDGSPADYSAENIPYAAPVHLKISTKGYQEGDFTMIMGFPGSTQRYMTSFEIDELTTIENPNRIFIRGERQKILLEDMTSDEAVRIKYASKYAQSANYWKNSIGMNNAIAKLNVRGDKEALESDFRVWAAADPSRSAYVRALPLIEQAVNDRKIVAGQMQYLAETILSPMEIARAAASFDRYMKAKNSGMNILPLEDMLYNVYKDYNEATDKRVMRRMLELIMENQPESARPEFMGELVMGKFDGDIAAFVDWVYETSPFANEEKARVFLSDFDADVMASDPALSIYDTTLAKYFALNDEVAEAGANFNEGHRLFIAGLQLMQPDKSFYPDANFTIRLTYGSILPYSPADAVDYNFFTTLTGVMEKEDPANPLEFTVPFRLRELYEAEDYGAFADFAGVTKKERKAGHKGHMNVGFISTNDITGGNSGSPVLNGNGELIGLAFDGNWEAMSGDVLFERNLQRCINVDVRYVLFVIDRFAGASHLLDELTIVN